MTPLKSVAFLAIIAAVSCQDYDYDQASQRRPAPARVQPNYSGAVVKPTPVPILKQINRHNDDGSYTYGYEGADGSFKIETKLATGEVKGKYGYIDDTGKVRVVEYGATKYGFEPVGEGITVPAPTLVDETTNKDGTLIPDYSPDYYEPQQAPPPRVAASNPRPNNQYSFDSYSAPQQFAPAPQRNPVPQRASVTGAIPIQQTNIDFASQSRSPPRSFAPAPAPSRHQSQQSFNFAPAPVDEEDQYREPAPAPRPKITYAQPAPVPARAASQFSSDFAPQSRPAAQQRPTPQQFTPRPAPQQFAPRPAPVARQSGGGGGILDQLAKDYALPQSSGAPLHDISFGYY